MKYVLANIELTYIYIGFVTVFLLGIWKLLAQNFSHIDFFPLLGQILRTRLLQTIVFISYSLIIWPF